jgi:hypothetical protein
LTTIDFEKIRSAPKSRNDCFEALAVQLFRKSYRPPADSTFVSLRGDGGDGGVEAYFRLPNGVVVGVQAKYFFQLKDAELRQIDKSLQTALENHPTLSEYWVYIPFDLTGRVAGRKGRSQAERFETWKQQIEADTTTRGSTLTVKLCTARIIQQQLLECDHHGGMRRYWFDDYALTKAQIQHCLNEAVAFAGPRYTAALDVVMNARIELDFFGGIGDFHAWRDESITPVIARLRSLMRRGDKSLEILGEPDATTAHKLTQQIVEACEGMTDLSSFASDATNMGKMLASVLSLLSKAKKAQEQAFYDKYGEKSDTPTFRQFHAEWMCEFPAGEMDAVREWEEQAQAFQTALSSPEISAATARSLLLVGPAGIGKTHSIVSAALRRLDHGGNSLIVFGDDFRGDEPWEVIRSKLGFGTDVTRPTLFECLQACADDTDLPFVIYIDALNESPRDARWKNKLPELLKQCEPYPGVKICVSTRDTYRNLVVDAWFPGYTFEHTGFAGQKFEAIQAFAKHYGLDAEITPLFSPELDNPLFLHLACKTLQSEGRTSLDVSFSGFTALLEGHLKHCDALVRERMTYSNPKNIVRAAMLRLSDVLTRNVPQGRTWEVCTTALQELCAGFTADALLKELEYEGLVILTSGECDTWFVRLGYQRYGDVLRATSLVEGLTESGRLDVPALASKLALLSPDDEGLLEALAAVLPEKSGMEITEKSLGIDPTIAHRLFIQALVWRSRNSITDDISDHVYAALRTPDLWQSAYEAFFCVSLIPRHKLNALNWLNLFLQDLSMVDRDVYLSVAAFKSFDAKGAVWSLINAALHAETYRWPDESRRLAVVALAWLTSCADRRVRDLSAKGLARLVEYHPELGKVLTDTFQGCDDDYVLESIALAIYSACLLKRGHEDEFIPALEGLLSPAFDSPNVLVRDSVRLLGQRVAQCGKLHPDVQKRLDIYPSKTPACTFWPKLSDAKPLLDLDLPMNMELWGSGLLPDFWRYQVKSRIHDFDLDCMGISHENVACWLMVEVLRLGYPGDGQRALKTDHAISSEFGNGRSRKGFADRLGKKYYWILFHRLLGLLADNVPPKALYSGWKPSPAYLWSIDVRKADLTDVRDIAPPREYPDEVIQIPKHSFPDRSSDIKQWVRTDDFLPYEACIVRTSNTGTEWVALSLGIMDSDRPPGEDSWTKPYFGVILFYASVFIDGDIPAFGQDEDVFGRQETHCYLGYLAEYPDGLVFEQAAEEGYFDRGPKGVDSSQVVLLRGNEWEYDFSYTTPERQGNLRVPCQNVVQELKLTWDRQRGWLDSNGELIVFDSSTKQYGDWSGLFIRRDALNRYLTTTKRKLVYQRFVNRGQRFVNRGFSADDSRDDLIDIDIRTWLLYRPSDAPEVLNEKKEPFNC